MRILQALVIAAFGAILSEGSGITSRLQILVSFFLILYQMLHPIMQESDPSGANLGTTRGLSTKLYANNDTNNFSRALELPCHDTSTQGKGNNQNCKFKCPMCPC